MKKLLTIFMTLMLALSLVACGGKDTDTSSKESQKIEQSDKKSDNKKNDKKDDKKEDKKDKEDKSDAKDDKKTSSKEDEDDIPAGDISDWLSTKTGKFYSQFLDGEMYIEYETKEDGATVNLKVAVKDENVFVETFADGEKLGIIIKGDVSYVIQHSYQMVLKTNVDPGAAVNFKEIIVQEGDMNLSGLKTGKREVDGKTYKTEYWDDVDGTSTTICFDGDKPVYIINNDGGQETIVKIVEMSNKVDDSLFELPEGYQVLG